MGKLTALSVKHAKPGRHADGEGLYLVVSDAGSRKWVLRIQKNEKRRDFGLGSASSVSLSEVREAATDMRRVIRDGADPSEMRRATEDQTKDVIPTFRDAAIMVHKEHLPSCRNKKHARQWLSTLGPCSALATVRATM